MSWLILALRFAVFVVVAPLFWIGVMLARLFFYEGNLNRRTVTRLWDSLVRWMRAAKAHNQISS